MATLKIARGYNNYFNRKLITSIPDEFVYEESATDFKPGDGVSTTYRAGRSGNPYYDDGDYIFVLDENGTESHWFIIESSRTARGQYILYLRRDLIRDYFNEWKSATSYIRKATLPIGSPLLFNKEKFEANQIKTSETLLKDESKMAWIVGFVNQEDADEAGKATPEEIDISSSVVYDYQYESEDACPLFGRTAKYANSLNNIFLSLWV